jgi:hypothetical protein
VLDVGGSLFASTVGTLTLDKEGFFAKCLSGKFAVERTAEGSLSLFVDRDPTHFRHILNFLRDREVSVPDLGLTKPELRQLAKEAKFYGLSQLETVLSEACPAESKSVLLELTLGARIPWTAMHVAEAALKACGYQTEQSAHPDFVLMRGATPLTSTAAQRVNVGLNSLCKSLKMSAGSHVLYVTTISNEGGHVLRQFARLDPVVASQKDGPLRLVWFDRES